MKSIIGILIIILITTPLSAIVSGDTTETNTTQQFTVMAKSGLKLRLSPNLDSPVIDVIQYGSNVTLLENTKSEKSFRINWVDGKWIKVNFNGQSGYLFDGFISKLAVPLHDSEFSSDLNGLSFALYSWGFRNHQLTRVDTLLETGTTFSALNYFGEDQMLVYDSEGMSKVEFTIRNIRIMDVYHLIESMMDTRAARGMFKENSMFYTGKTGNVEKIKIGQGEVLIKKFDSGEVKVTCVSRISGC